VQELLKDGPNDQGLNKKLAELTQVLDVGGEALKAAIEANQQLKGDN